MLNFQGVLVLVAFAGGASQWIIMVAPNDGCEFRLLLKSQSNPRMLSLFLKKNLLSCGHCLKIHNPKIPKMVLSLTWPQNTKTIHTKFCKCLKLSFLGSGAQIHMFASDLSRTRKSMGFSFLDFLKHHEYSEGLFWKTQYFPNGKSSVKVLPSDLRSPTCKRSTNFHWYLWIFVLY